MKTRVRQLVNGQWIMEMEVQSWFNRKWKAAYIYPYDTVNSVRNGKSAKTIELQSPGDGHYASMWKDTREEAFEVEKEVWSVLGKSNEDLVTIQHGNEWFTSLKGS